MHDQTSKRNHKYFIGNKLQNLREIAHAKQPKINTSYGLKNALIQKDDESQL